MASTCAIVNLVFRRDEPNTNVAVLHSCTNAAGTPGWTGGLPAESSWSHTSHRRSTLAWWSQKIGSRPAVCRAPHVAADVAVHVVVRLVLEQAGDAGCGQDATEALPHAADVGPLRSARRRSRRPPRAASRRAPGRAGCPRVRSGPCAARRGTPAGGRGSRAGQDRCSPSTGAAQWCRGCASGSTARTSAGTPGATAGSRACGARTAPTKAPAVCRAARRGCSPPIPTT